MAWQIEGSLIPLLVLAINQNENVQLELKSPTGSFDCENKARLSDLTPYISRE